METRTPRNRREVRPELRGVLEEKRYYAADTR
jgi:hypothetical protein